MARPEGRSYTAALPTPSRALWGPLLASSVVESWKESNNWLLGEKALMFASASGVNTPTMASFKLTNGSAPIVELGPGVQVWFPHAGLSQLLYSKRHVPGNDLGGGPEKEGSARCWRAGQAKGCVQEASQGPPHTPREEGEPSSGKWHWGYWFTLPPPGTRG